MGPTTKIVQLISLLTLGCLVLSCSGGNGNDGLSTVSINDAQIDESDSNVTVQFFIELSKPSEVDISLEVRTEPITADEEDFIPLDTIVIFRAGNNRLPISITILGDERQEQDESFRIILDEPFNATLLKDRATITILNDDVLQFSIPTTGYVSSDSYEGMSLVWSDEFEGTAVDQQFWTFDIGDGCNQGNCGWGNNELQYYQQENASIVDGNLVIEARRQSSNGYNFTSSKILTRDKVSLQYGRIDVRAAMPEGKGMWPAIWMLGNNLFEVGWPASGEIDIMEMIGGGDNERICHGTVHWQTSSGNAANFGGQIQSDRKLSEEFHVYSIVWDEESIIWYFDDVQYHAIDISPEDLSEFREEFYLILNVAVGGNWPGSPDPSTIFPHWMIVDYVRYFQN